MSDSVESLASRFGVLWPHLSERQRRLWLGAEARELGPGGVAIVARAVGVAGDTVRRGRTELQEPLTLSYPRSRRPGGGRKRAEAGDPALVEALDKLVDPVTRGDPMSPLRWTSKSLRTLAKALQEQGHQVSEQIVRRLLREAGYSVQANAKTLQAASIPTATPSSATWPIRPERTWPPASPWSAWTRRRSCGTRSHVASELAGRR